MIVFVILFSRVLQILADPNTSVIVCGPNEILVDSKTTCPPQSCDLAYTDYLCDPNSKKPYDPGCDCIENYLRDDGGVCIFNEDCPYPINKPVCSDYEELITCGSGSTEECKEGCKCIENYVRDTNGTCIYLQCGYNEAASEVKQTCPPQSCSYSPDKQACKPGPARPGCNCIGDYLRNSSDVCVPKDQCDSESEVTGKPEPSRINTKHRSHSSSYSSSATSSASALASYDTVILSETNKNTTEPQEIDSSPIICGPNEILVDSKTTCPPQSCDLAYTEYLCDPIPKKPYDPGCDCIENYLRDDSGVCIFNEDCPYTISKPVCGDYEELITCGCESSEECKEGCKCIENYVRDTNGTCIYLQCGYNEVASEVKQTCPPQSCSYSPDKQACKPGPARPGCNCIGDYLRNSNDVCVPKDQCDSESENLDCNGDLNATYKECPNPCTSTCKNPNASPCIGQCEAQGCQCNPLYLLSDEGKCILPDDCPGGNPCSQNETFIYCNVGCPTNYCPQNDNRAIIACSPPYPCPSGCGCKQYYRRLSSKDNRCILASDCPPVNCTRQNEVWNPCTPPCFTERCQDLNQPARDCWLYDEAYCQPQCVCMDGYRRNQSDICVAVASCASEV